MTDIYNARSSYPRLPSYASYPQQHQHQQNLNQQFNNPPESNHDYYPGPAHDDMDDAQLQQGDKHDSARTQSATFLTKLYTLLEKPEYQHMIRWDPKGEQIIVERPEQLALHVLPSIYRQSRFASFSRQLNIYGFMRKVNLRNVDPAIDDPDASTWSHPTLNRHSPPEMVANFKRRVPPRPPKGKRRPEEVAQGQGIPSSSSKGSIGSGKHLPSLSASVDNTQYGSLQPVIPHSSSSSSDLSLAGGSGLGPQQGSAKWTHPYGRSALPPLTIPGSSSSQGDFPSLQQQQQQQQQQAYLNSAGGAASAGGGGGGRYGNVHPITPTDDVAYATPNVYQPRDHHSHLFGFNSSSSGPGGSAVGGTPSTEVPSPMGFGGVPVSTATPFTTTSAGWTPSPYDAPHHPYSSGGGGPQLPPLNTQSGSGSLSALLNRSDNNNNSARSPPQHHLASSYPSPYGAVPPHGGLSRGGPGGGGGGDSPTATSASVSRPTTGYSSVSSGGGGGGSGGGGGYHSHSHSHSHSAGGHGGHVQQSPIDYQHPAYGQHTMGGGGGGGGMRRPSSSGGPPPPGSAGSGAIRRIPTREHMGLGAMPYPGSNQRHQQHHQGPPSSVLDDEGSTPPSLMNFSSSNNNGNNNGSNSNNNNNNGNGGRPLTAPAQARRSFNTFTPITPQRTSTSYGMSGAQQQQQPQLTLLTSGFAAPSGPASGVGGGGPGTPTPTTHYSSSGGAGGQPWAQQQHTPMSPTATFAYTVSGNNPPSSSGAGAGPGTSGGGGGGEFAYTVPPQGSSHGLPPQQQYGGHRDSPSYSQSHSRPGTATSMGGESLGGQDESGAAAAAALYGMSSGLVQIANNGGGGAGDVGGGGGQQTGHFLSQSRPQSSSSTSQ